MNLAQVDLSAFTLLNLQADSWDVIESAFQHFRQLAGVEIAPVACHPDSGYKKIDGHQTVASWLSNDANISIEKATEIINGFPIPVASRLNQIAMNPCRFLGLASSITRSPDSIVFSTSGMDPLGFKRLHQYATKQFDGTLIHLDISPCEYCQSNGQSFRLHENLTVIAS